jgi:hypothetical protein
MCQKTKSGYGYDNKYSWCSSCSKIIRQQLNIEKSRWCNIQKNCQECNNNRASYGYDTNKFMWCSDCARKKWQELNISEDRRCTAQKLCEVCNKIRPSYGYDGRYLWCSPCSKSQYTELNIEENRRCDFNKKCSYIYPDTTTCPVQVCKDRDMCVRHDTSQSRRRKSRELKVVDFLRSQNNFLSSFLHNPYEVVEHSSFRRLHYFPDVLYDCGEHFVHLEIDENQHKSYSCECQRILELNQSRPKPTLLVRYNPDTFHFDGEKIKIPNKKRLATLVDVLTWAISENGKNTAKEVYSECKTSVVPPILVLYMYYDEMGWKEEEQTCICELRILSMDKDNHYFSEQFIMPNHLDSFLP